MVSCGACRTGRYGVAGWRGGETLGRHPILVPDMAVEDSCPVPHIPSNGEERDPERYLKHVKRVKL